MTSCVSSDRFYDGIGAMLKSDVKGNIGRAACGSHIGRSLSR